MADKFRMLGESGLWEDEEGNMYSPSELEGYKPADAALGKWASEKLKNVGVQEALNDKTNPDYWFFDYDPRYCGPDREAWMEMMAARARADKEQQEILLQGIHPAFEPGASKAFRGVADGTGRLIIRNEKYHFVDQFCNGLARAQDKVTRKWGFIDRHGNEVIPCIWNSAGNFSGYLACVQDDHTRLCGYCDVQGKLVIPCIWEDGWEFKDYQARVKADGRLGMIDTRGRQVIPCVWKGLGEYREHLMGARNEEDRCGYINSKGEIVIPCQWKEVWPFHEGMAIVQDFNDLFGYVNKKGEVIIPPIWKKAMNFENGIAIVSNSKRFLLWDKWVRINTKGEIVKG